MKASATTTAGPARSRSGRRAAGGGRRAAGGGAVAHRVTRHLVVVAQRPDGALQVELLRDASAARATARPLVHAAEWRRSGAGGALTCGMQQGITAQAQRACCASSMLILFTCVRTIA